jgi:8-oxo-dGTP diphosphatase
MARMVVGFMIDESKENVVLIRKLRPEWMKGLLNGVGGKIEKDESPIDAMVREYKEETGVDTIPWNWYPFLTMTGGDFEIFYYMASGDISTVQTMEDEEIVIIPIDSIQLRDKTTIDNLPWILSLGLNVINNGPKSAHVYY